jgi:D-lactate dehydrogenase
MNESINNDTVLSALRAALGAERVWTESGVLELYASDDGPGRCPPRAVLFPRGHDEVAALVRIAHAARLPLVARGAGSGNVGGARPTPGSAVVSFECMQRIFEFDPADRLMRVEAGAITAEIERLARSNGLFYPPDPGSASYCRIGGNLAMNAAGPRALKYGVTGDYVLGLRAVAGDGRTLVSGCRTSKGVVGYDLTQLLVGSEGTLALITEATLKLLPAPATVGTLRVCYDSSTRACEAVQRVMTQPVIPCALEFMDTHALAAIQRAGGAADLPVDARAMLMVEADGEPDEVVEQLEKLQSALNGPGWVEAKQAMAAEEITRLWSARRALSGAVKAMAPLKINEDVVVPVSRLVELMARIEDLARRYALPIVSFGHAGNGNLHVNIVTHPERDGEMARAQDCLRELFEAVLQLGGTLSGEHGIGAAKRAFVPLEIPADTLALMRAIKREFDPRGILNPGKLFPEIE